MSQNHGRSSTQKRKLKSRLFGGRKEKSCCFCRVSLTLTTATIEHVKPLSNGGGWEIENLRVSCSLCNGRRGSKDFDEFRKEIRARIEQAAQQAEDDSDD